MRALIDLPAYVRALPRHAISRTMGVLARTQVPSFLLAPAIAAYARAFGVNLEEADRRTAEYESFLDFFTRRLRPGTRPLPNDPLAIAAPADGRVQAAGVVHRGSVLQAKGVPYRVPDLIGRPDLAHRLDGGSWMLTYLAPGDYHRFHWPFDAVVEGLGHLPGDLWPVHPRAVRALPGLFVRNERVVVHGRLGSGARFAWVAIGALNVGSIRLAFHPLRTNRSAPARPRRWVLPDLTVRRGEEAGWFEMGSALALFVSRRGGRLDPLEPGVRLRQGQAIGRLKG